MLEDILPIFLQILEHIDQEHVTCFPWKTVKISILNMLLPILDETRILPMLETIVHFLLNIDPIDQKHVRCVF